MPTRGEDSASYYATNHSSSICTTTLSRSKSLDVDHGRATIGARPVRARLPSGHSSGAASRYPGLSQRRWNQKGQTRYLVCPAAQAIPQSKIELKSKHEVPGILTAGDVAERGR